MKLKEFNTATHPKIVGGGNKAARVSFGKAGTVHFNAVVCSLMGLSPGDKVSIAQDEEEPTEWYFFKDAAKGFLLRSGYDKKGCLFNHSKVIRDFLAAQDLTADETHSFLIAGQPTVIKGDKNKTEYWCILVTK